MIGRWKKDLYPKSIQDYLNAFKQKRKLDLQEQRFVVFDTETTGFDLKKDRVLSIGAVAINGNKIHLKDSFECFLQQSVFNSGTVEIHGIRKNGSQNKLEEKEAIAAFLKYISNAVLVGHHVGFDIAMINAALSRLKYPKLKNKALDTGVLIAKLPNADRQGVPPTLDDLATRFKVPLNDRHTAQGDAYITALVFVKMLRSLQKLRPVSISDLFLNP